MLTCSPALFSRNPTRRQLAAVKCYQTKQLQLGVAAALAENPDLIISSSSNEEVNAMMMCDAVLHTMTPGEPLNRSQVRTHNAEETHSQSPLGNNTPSFNLTTGQLT